MIRVFKAFFEFFLTFLIIFSAFGKEEDFSSAEDFGFFKKDTEYYKTSVMDNLDIVYSEDFKSFVPVLSDYVKKIDFSLSQFFQKKPYYKKHSIVFLSSQVQLPNAYAAAYPVPYVVMYPSAGAYFMDRWSLFYWTRDVLFHEMTHIYQLSQNFEWERWLWWLFGPFSHRNLMLSSFVIEGAAVLNESIYGLGGRLFSGWSRAFVFSQLKRGYTLKRLLKSYDDSFSGEEKYLHGGYFFAYLHSQYDLERISHFFYESGTFVPIGFEGLNRTAKNFFGKGIDVLFESYKRYYTPLAKKQKSSSGKSLLSSKVDLPMNGDKNKIYFLVSDMKSPPSLVLFDKKTKKIKKEKTILPLGKIFYQDGQYYSSGLGRVSSTSVKYSLFKEYFRPVSKYNSLHVMDFYKKQFIALDTRQNHSQNSLFLNKVFYDTTHSSAVMDQKGGIYYFKQKKNIRILYRNKKSLFRFPSYFSYPVEADEEGLYFIGATKYGTSLFVYKESEGVFRLTDSDTVSQARKIKGNEFLVSEIGPEHYSYKIIQTKKTPEQPFLYTYSFKKENIFDDQLKSLDRGEEGGGSESLKKKSFKKKKLSKMKSIPLLFENSGSYRREKNEKPQPDQYESNSKQGFRSKEPKKIKSSMEQKSDGFHQPYYSISNLALRQMFLFASLDRNFIFDSQFLDPLKRNELSLSGIFGAKRKSFSLSYAYEKYRPSLAVSLIYDENHLKREKNKYNIQTLKDIGLLDEKDIFYPMNSSSKSLKSRDYIFQRSRAVELSWSYPLKIRSYRIFWMNSLQLGQKQFNNKSRGVLSYKPKVWKSYLQHKGGLKLNFERKYKYAYSSHKKKGFHLIYKMFHLKTARQSYSTRLSAKAGAYLTKEFGKEWFVTLNGEVKKKLWDRGPKTPLLRTTDNPFSLFLQNLIDVYLPMYGSFKEDFENLYQLDFQVLKVLNHSYYPLKIPFSVRRLAPLGGMSFLSLQPNNGKYKSFLIPFAGVEWELSLFLEKNIFKLGLVGDYAIDLSGSSRPTFHLNAWLKGSF